MIKRHRIRWLVCAGSLIFISSCYAADTNRVVTPNAHIVRSTNWAQPITIAGIDNCYQVSSNLFRGAQPTAKGMENLKSLGIKTVINLRAFHSDKNKVAGTGLKSVRFETKPWHAEEEDVAGFLKVMADTNNLPAFVHCERGADRTGMMCAMYRVAICGWSKDDAIAEMTEGGFRYNPTWRNLVNFIEKADIAELKHRAGLPEK